MTANFAQQFYIMLIQCTIVPALKVAVALLFLYIALLVLRSTIEAYNDWLEGGGY